jgi:uncharacterized protein YdaU (DUF1376 family)
MAKKIPYMQFYPADYLQDTKMLGHEEKGFYTDLMFNMWLNGGELPNDDVKISRLLAVPVNKWKKIRKKLENFFEFSDEFFTQKRIQRDYKKLGIISDIRAKSGGAGGRKTAENRQSALANATDLLEQNPSKEDSKQDSEYGSKIDSKNAVTRESQNSDVVVEEKTTNNTEEEKKITSDKLPRAKSFIPRGEISPAFADSSLNFNDFNVSMDVVCLLLFSNKNKKLSLKDQALLSLLCGKYEMPKVLTVVDNEIKKFREREGGKTPNSLAYFCDAIFQQCESLLPVTVRELKNPPGGSVAIPPEELQERIRKADEVFARQRKERMSVNG